MSSIERVTTGTFKGRRDDPVPVHEVKISEASPLLPRRLTATIWGSGAAMLVLVPLAFGGVHAQIYAPLQALVFVLAGFALISLSRSGAPLLPRGAATRALLAAGAFLLIAAAVRTGVSSFTAPPHPLFDLPGGGISNGGALRGLREILFFAAVVFLVRTGLVGRPFALTRVVNVLCGAGIACAFVGLAHWFYDNGRLFWFFEPENIFISDRARWPFVNSNHLAAFLLPTFFLLLARVVESTAELSNALASGRADLSRRVSDLFRSARAQRLVIGAMFSAACLLAVGLTIVATLSRGVWTSAVFGVVLFIVLEGSTRPQAALPGGRASSSGLSSRPPSGRRRRRDHPQRWHQSALISPRARRWLTIGGIALLAFAGYAFIGDRGAELIESRIEYGLLYSKEDMRLQLLHDTWPIVSAHLVFGIGLGGWANEYARHMSPLLSGVDPVYLHNEPVQLLAELGLVGVLPVLLAVALVTLHTWRSLRTSSYRLILAALLTSTLTTLVATAFDFHLRIPATVLQLAVLCGLILFIADTAPPRAGKRESRGVDRHLNIE